MLSWLYMQGCSVPLLADSEEAALEDGHRTGSTKGTSHRSPHSVVEFFTGVARCSAGGVRAQGWGRLWNLSFQGGSEILCSVVHREQVYLQRGDKLLQEWQSLN